jgi:hypothetical protein
MKFLSKLYGLRIEIIQAMFGAILIFAMCWIGAILEIIFTGGIGLK